MAKLFFHVVVTHSFFLKKATAEVSCWLPTPAKDRTHVVLIGMTMSKTTPAKKEIATHVILCAVAESWNTAARMAQRAPAKTTAWNQSSFSGSKQTTQIANFELPNNL